MRGSLLPIAAVALLALCATASPAPGQPVFTASAPAKVKGKRTGSGQFTLQGVEIDCDRILFSGDLAKASPTLALVMEHYECTAKALTGLPVDFIPEFACKYALHGLRPTGDAHWKAAVDFRCPGEADGYAVEFFETYEDFLQVNPLCSTWMLERPDIGTAELRNLPGKGGGIEVRWDLRELEYEVYSPRESGSSLICGAPPGNIGSDLSFAGTSVLFAHDHEGRPVQLSVKG